MREMQDGGAIYGHLVRAVVRGNVVRDVVAAGAGYGVFAYYLDEQAQDTIVERNVSIGVETPLLCHIARNVTIRDNLFMSDGAMSLAFARSANCAFERNTLFARGPITFQTPNAIKLWRDNVVYRSTPTKAGAPQPFTISDAMPPVARPGRRASPAVVVRAAEPPTLCYDERCLYVAVVAGVYQISKLRAGSAWGKDDGAEISLAGRSPGGKPATFVLRGYPDGTLQSVGDAGAPAETAARLGKAVRFATGKWRPGWRGEWAIPWEALGLKPQPGLKIPFNLAVYRSEDEVWRCWEGTLAETWRLDQAGRLQLK